MNADSLPTFTIDEDCADKLRAIISDANQWGYNSDPWERVIDSLVNWMVSLQSPTSVGAPNTSRRISQLRRLVQSLESCAYNHSCNSEILIKYSEALAEVLAHIEGAYNIACDASDFQPSTLIE